MTIEHVPAVDDFDQPGEGKVRCEACPIRCFIKPGQTGSCDRYGNVDGVLTRMDPVVVLERAIERGDAVVSFTGETSGSVVSSRLSAAGAGTTYPDYKPAPFIVSAEYEGVDTVTVVTDTERAAGF